MEDDSTAIDSSSDNQLTIMEQCESATSPDGGQSPQGEEDDVRHVNPISSSGAVDADDESETDELTIDDSCVNTEDMMDDDNNVAIVSSSTLHQMHEDEEEQDEQDGGGGAASSSYMSSETDVVAVSSKPLHDEDDDDNDAAPMDEEECENEKNEPQQALVVSTSTSSTMPVPQSPSPPPVDIPVEKPVNKRLAGDAEDDDVDIDGIEEATPVTAATPTSPQGPESPVLGDTPGSPDGASQEPGKSPTTARSPSPPHSPEHLTPPNENAGPNLSDVSPMSLKSIPQNSQTEAIVSQDDFSQFDSSSVSLSTITSTSQSSKIPSSQGTSAPDHNVTLDEDAMMDTSQLDSSQPGTQSSPRNSETDNDESQQSSIIVQSEKSVSNGAVPKSRSKSRSRSNTDDGEGEMDDVDLEDGEIMDDEEEELKTPTASLKDKKEKDKSSKSSSSSSHKDKSSDKERDRSSREKEKEKEREKEKHRKDKKRSKREEEKEKESSKKTKKRKVSDAGESEQEEFLHVRGVSPGSAPVPPAADPWGAVEEFGDDSIVSRAKRRRDSDGEGSPHHHHHHHSASRPPREPSPPIAPGRRPDNRNKRPVREERKEPKSDVICAYFMQGKCQKSSIDCSFSHDAVPPRKMELCKFWMMECCAKKEKCLYLHNDFPCKYFHTGLICKAGDRCKFSHNPLSDVTKQVLLKHIETAPKEILGDFPRLNRQGAINLINKMEARLRGEKVDDDNDAFAEMNQNEHHGRGQMPPSSHHDNRHHGHGHGRNDDRHARGGGGRDHHGNHGGHHPHMNQRGGNTNDMRGVAGRGEDRHHNTGNNNNNNNNRASRWEKQQPTRGDQEKLHELMEEAGISGFYKDTLESGLPPPNQHGPPGPFPPMQPPLLPLNPALMSQMLPGFMPHNQPNTVNNPTLANVLASLNIPSTSIAPPTTHAGSLPPLTGANALPNHPPPAISQASNDSNSSSDKTIPDHLPKMQQELFKRIQKQQQKNEKKMQNFDKPEPEEPEQNWYSSEDEEEESKKKESSKTEISDKISSVLNQIRQQTQPSSSPALPSSLPLPPVSEPSLPSFYRDTDFRNQPSSFKDIDLRNPGSIFKKIDIEPAKEINASLAHNGPFPYKVRKVAGIPKIDYSTVRMGLPPSSIVLDPRLGPKRHNSIPAPASPTENSGPDVGLQPLTIPDGTPVFDPRTMRAGGNAAGSSGSGRNSGPPGITPQQNNPFLDSDNRFVSLPNSGMNDFPSFFNRDPRAGGPGGAPNQPGPGPGQPPNIAAMAAAMAAMQQQLPNMQGPAGLDPSLFGMLGFPFLPQQPGGVQNPMDFQQMLSGAGGGNLRMRPPFTSQQPPPSSWERLNQGQQGQGGGDLTPPL